MDGTFAQVKFRDCAWCGLKQAHMRVEFSARKVRSDGGRSLRSWAGLACPRCAGMTLVEVEIQDHPSSSEATIADSAIVDELQALPEGIGRTLRVRHLPADVERFYSDAIRVLDAGVPDAVAVQLRRTLEAAAADRGFTDRVLVKNVEAMIAAGIVTTDFGAALTHVRRLGNIGAHASDRALTSEEAARALRFTTQFLRNVYEVPGELSALAAEADSEDESPEPGPSMPL